MLYGTVCEEFMPEIFEITGDDIAKLDDNQLRELIGLLCEEDFRRSGLNPNDVTWGGHQDAADGGFDVVVEARDAVPNGSPIERANTGIQVKKPNMPASAIEKEMCPKGELRDSIKALIKKSGSYVIVSGSGTLAHPRLKERRTKMRELVQSHDPEQMLHLDFMDRGRVATWVRKHRPMALWVKRKIGAELRGWRPYENWAGRPQDGVDDEYLVDDGLRLFDGTVQSDEPLSALEGIERLRDALHSPGSSVRLAGLSGVGKTRLVQALFDDRLGANALPQSLAVYTDMSLGPAPAPEEIAYWLANAGGAAVLVVDNCPPELHRQLTRTCQQPGGRDVRLLTVEYDVRDDLPDETSVFRLEPASAELIEDLIERRYPHINQVDRQTISEFSGGNARLAIALANTVKSGDTLSGFSDSDLFERLFRQRNESDPSLMKSAEVVSLVYSFDGENAEPEGSELAVLAKLASVSVNDLYGHVVEIKRRDLIQSRNIWRAVLPHAVANRLAKSALEKIPRATLESTFRQCGSERLIRSLTRRLNFLHDCAEAVAITDGWLEADGWLGDAAKFDDFQLSLFENIAPVSQDKTLGVIERAANGEGEEEFTTSANSRRGKFIGLLRSLAYEPDLFERAAEILVRFSVAEDPMHKTERASGRLASLFNLCLSGTMALPGVRFAFIKGLARSNSEERRALSVVLLDAALEAWHFTSAEHFDFGARPRSFGYEPETDEELLDWYRAGVALAAQFADTDSVLGKEMRQLLANSFRGLWTRAWIHPELESVAAMLHNAKPWTEGWIATRQTLRFDAECIGDEAAKRLRKLEEMLRPTSLVDRARAYAFGDKHYALEMTEDDEGEQPSSGLDRVREITRAIGVELAGDVDALETLLPELVSKPGHRVSAVGWGLCEGSNERGALWSRLQASFEQASEKERNINIMVGFLVGAARVGDDRFCNETLDRLLTDPVLGQWFPCFQNAVGFDAPRAVERLRESLSIGLAGAGCYMRLAWGRAHEPIGDDDLADLLRLIATMPDGSIVCTDILKMRFHCKDDVKFSEELLSVGRDLLSQEALRNDHPGRDSRDHEMASIAKRCLVGPEGKETARKMCRSSAVGIADFDIYTMNFPELTARLTALHPAVFLDEFFHIGHVDEDKHARRVSLPFQRRRNPLQGISDDDLIAWCELDAVKRYPLVAAVAEVFKPGSVGENDQWLPLFFEIAKRAPALRPVLENVVRSLRPSSWSGSLAEILQGRMELFPPLFEYSNEEVAAWAKRMHRVVDGWVSQERQYEEGRRILRDESFE